MKRLLLFGGLHFALAAAPVLATGQVLLAQHRNEPKANPPARPTTAPKTATTLASALNELHRQRGLYFSYDERRWGQHPVNPPGSGRGSGEQLLTRLLAGTGLTFKAVGGNIFVIAPRQELEAPAPSSAPATPNPVERAAPEPGSPPEPAPAGQTDALPRAPFPTAATSVDRTVRGSVTSA